MLFLCYCRLCYLNQRLRFLFLHYCKCPLDEGNQQIFSRVAERLQHLHADPFAALPRVCKTKISATDQCTKTPRSNESHFLSLYVDSQVQEMGKRWQHGALQEEGKPTEALFCSGQRSAGKPWLLAFLWNTDI